MGGILVENEIVFGSGGELTKGMSCARDTPRIGLKL